MKKIINTEYKDLMRFIFRDYRLERRVPVRDGFLLVKDLVAQEYQLLQRYESYIIISKPYFEETWDRKEIVDYIKTVKGSRRKCEFEKLSEEEFEYNVKVFMMTGVWTAKDMDESMFELFKEIDGGGKRLKEYFKLRKIYSAQELISALLTFTGKVLTVEGGDVSNGYFRVIYSKRDVIKKNFRKALDNYSRYDKEVDQDVKTIKFMEDLGSVR